MCLVTSRVGFERVVKQSIKKHITTAGTPTSLCARFRGTSTRRDDGGGGKTASRSCLRLFSLMTGERGFKRNPSRTSHYIYTPNTTVRQRPTETHA